MRDTRDARAWSAWGTPGDERAEAVRLDGLSAAAFIRERERAGLRLYPHQVATLRRVVGELDGSAILADEVGLGKTIEAGLIRAELLARGLEGPTLILTPAGLVGQWQREWDEKFGWRLLTTPRARGDAFIQSIDAAKRSPFRDALERVSFGLVVVDEAHRLKNARTQNHELVASLKARHLILLTATPMENQLTELYQLVNLVKPGLFGSYLRFYRQFILDKRTPKNAAELRDLLSRVMVRHQRHEVGDQWPAREVTLCPLRLSPEERTLYDHLSARLRFEYRTRVRQEVSILPVLTLQRELCSSPDAIRSTLLQADWLGPDKDIFLGELQQIAQPSKARTTVELIRSLGEQVVVFTEFRATQERLVERLAKAGVESRAFHGGLPVRERDRRLAWFRDGGQVLVSTEAGGQGLNLQWCHHLINYDLPWNPMRIEQRIGRLHRIGQQNTVHIFNLVTVETVEEHVLWLLHEKIDLFRQVIGELDVILRHLERRRGSLEGRLLAILMEEEDAQQLGERLDQLGREFTATRNRLSWPAPDSAAGTPKVRYT
ncbi:MAG: DEAD/DEAH box helicase [Clostridia bacterium]